MRTGKLAWFFGIATFVLLLTGTRQAEATIVVEIGDGSGGFESLAPFGDSGSGPSTRYQQIYSNGLFSVPFTIDKITFFDRSFGQFDTAGDTIITNATYDIRLSTTSQAVNVLNNVTFDNNVGGDEAVFFVGLLGGSLNGNPEFSIQGASFPYDPVSGNLLLDIRRANVTPTTGPGVHGFLDAFTQNVGDATSLVTDFGFEGGATSGNAFLASPTGLVTRFEGAPTIPEPSSVYLFGSGLLGLAGWRRRRKKA